MSRRGQVQLVDAVVTVIVVVGLLALTPVFRSFIDMVTAETGGFVGLVLQLAIPLLFLSVIVSVGISARGGT
jgi:CHASE1-domain containing sensor protein